MSTVLSTNARDLYDEDGDFVGYDLPDADPVNIDTRWITRWGKDDELVYVVTWENGITADMFSLPNGWHDIYLASIRRRHEAGLAKLDATLEQLRTEHVRAA